MAGGTVHFITIGIIYRKVIGHHHIGDQAAGRSLIILKLKRVKRLSTTRTRVSYGITQFYLPPDRGDAPAINTAEAGTTFIDAEG